MKSVIITGASSGIGRVCALHMDKLGYRVFAGVRKTMDGETLRKSASQRLIPINIDVTDEVSIAAAATKVEEVIGPEGLFALVNNAGIAKAGIMEFLSLNDLRNQLEVNTIGLVAVTKAFIPLLRKGCGRIINIGSVSGISCLPLQGPYCASKFAVEALSDALRLELRPWGIPVSIVEPGDIVTPIWEKARQHVDNLVNNLPEHALEMYGPLIEMMKKWIHTNRGIPAMEVAKNVERLLKSPKPKARVLVGADAKFLAFIEKLPTWLRDGLVSLKLPKYGK